MATLTAYSNAMIPRAPTTTNICAIVITFNPDEGLSKLIQTLLIQFPKILIIDNGSKTFPLIEKNLKIEIRYNTYNLGIAKALNQGLEDALESGYEWVVTFDQDSEPCAEFLHEIIRSCKQIKAAEFLLGANYYDAHRDRIAHLPPSYSVTTFARTTLITSGMLLRIEFARAIGGFRNEYFIDSVDHEFCLRAFQHGAKILITTTPLMRHHIGIRHKAARWASALSSSHEPGRKYYIARNTLWTARTYIRTNPIWCAHQIARLFAEFAGIIFFENRRKAKISAFTRGLKDGLNRRDAR